MSSIPKTQKAFVLTKTGDSLDVLKYQQDYPVPTDLSPHDILIKNKYSGVNYIENYFRTGIYPVEKPTVLGREATGVIVAKGEQIQDFNIGDSVAYLSTRTFAQYTKYNINENSQILKLSENGSSKVSDDDLKLYAASLIQGLTALTFSERAYKVKSGDYVLVYAAAGGVGLLLNQLIRAKGAHPIAIASTDEKLKLASENGAEFLIKSKIDGTDDDKVVEQVLKFTNGEGVAAVFDSLGKNSFDISMKALKRLGTFVSFGNATGVVPPISINVLSPKNITLLRPVVFHYIYTRKEFEQYTAKLFDLIRSGKLNILIYKTYPLSEYKVADQELLDRKTVGKLVLKIPE
ncbi:probable Probable quinone oxidoreductase [Saccharomycodes ludwigii]|uniref:Probable Probable quinone oxidoreductase n=1 Tax=Saccharomycodes ludwigii TaxID=36035 RepID=A0A376B6W1_9ASCO|nr:hypothetical protein SCDLUD_003331 [Saccharomycodes ludwigii]KAH3900357.1 hypothetical protein SCDLUD_003331 [Saccharomycodes ludwigii]SSD60371.1 probable Probable quinone oxidoreductase [Saccharomycodes ludwigii]